MKFRDGYKSQDKEAQKLSNLTPKCPFYIWSSNVKTNYQKLILGKEIDIWMVVSCNYGLIIKRDSLIYMKL